MASAASAWRAETLHDADEHEVGHLKEDGELLISRVRRSGSLPEEGLACIVGLPFIDRWEARRRDARARVAPTLRR
jgi:hypothetical protein